MAMEIQHRSLLLQQIEKKKTSIIPWNVEPSFPHHFFLGEIFKEYVTSGNDVWVRWSLDQRGSWKPNDCVTIIIS